MFSGKTLLITGGTGSFGNAVLRRFLDDRHRARSASSAGTRRSRTTCASQYRSDKLKFYIGDVRNPDRLRDAMEGVDYVFHAAALKQVPSCEFYPHGGRATPTCSAPRTCSRAAIAAGVAGVVVLSTDKAVYPINAMGMSKAMMEKIMVAQSRDRCRQGRARLCVHALRQRDGLAGFGDPAVRRADPQGPAADGHRPGHDALHDVAGRRRGPGALRFRARRSRATSSCRRPRPPPSAPLAEA